MTKIDAYKGFNPDMTCGGNGDVPLTQYEQNGDYDFPAAKACKRGAHACTNALDVFGYYPPGTSKYHEVECSGEIDHHGADSKIACTHIKIGAEISLTGMVAAGVKFIMDRVDWTSAKESNTGYQSAATNTGDRSAATNTGDQSAATVEGKDSVACALGFDSAAKGALGCGIVIAERGDWNGETYPLIGVKAAIVDGEKIKADTWYKLVGGEFVEQP